jgi:hypothetical protein
MMELSDEQWFDLVHDGNMVVVDDFDLKIRRMHGVAPDDVVIVFDSQVQHNLRRRPLIFDRETCADLIRLLSASLERLNSDDVSD